MRFLLYSSHYMYLGLMTFLHTFYFIYINIYVCMMYVFHLYLTCVFSFLSLCSCFFFYITCLHFTLDALMDFFLSVLVKTSCKSFMP